MRECFCSWKYLICTSYVMEGIVPDVFHKYDFNASMDNKSKNFSCSCSSLISHNSVLFGQNQIQSRIISSLVELKGQNADLQPCKILSVTTV